MAINSKSVLGLNAFPPPFLSKSLNLSTPDNVTDFDQHAAVHSKSKYTDMSLFAKYMLHKELTKKGPTKVEDKLENHRGRKSTSISELNVTTTEDLDLPIRWLSP